MEHGLPDPQQLSNGGEGSNEQNDRRKLHENEEAYDDDIAMEDRPPDDIESLGHQENKLVEDDIAENDPIHDYETSEMDESEESSSDTEDDEPTEQEYNAFKIQEDIQEAQKMGLKFSGDGRLRGTPVLACLVRHGIFELFGPIDARMENLLSRNTYQEFRSLRIFSLSLVEVYFRRQERYWAQHIVSSQRGHLCGEPIDRPRDVSQAFLALRETRSENWMVLPALRRLIRTVLRYQPKEFEKQGQIQISNQIRQPDYRNLLSKIYDSIYYLPLEQVAFVANQLLFERPRRTLKLTSETLEKSESTQTNCE